MFRSGWRDHASLVGAGLIVVGLVAISPISASIEQDRREQEQSAQETAASNRDAGRRFSLLGKEEQTASSDERERAREQREESDLVAQWASADAARAQIALNILGLIGLGLTVWFARNAWLAAKDSAKADNEALELTKTQLSESRKAAVDQRVRTDADATVQQERFDLQIKEAQRAANIAQQSADKSSFVGRNQFRAYVHVSDARLDYTTSQTLVGGGFRPEIFLKFENVGATPTKSVGYCVVPGCETFDEIHKGYRPVRHLSPNETVNLAPRDTQEVNVFTYKLEETLSDGEPGKWNSSGPVSLKYFTIRGRVIYKDVFDQEHYSDFGFRCFRPTPGTNEPMKPMVGAFVRYEPYPPVQAPKTKNEE